MTRHRPGAVAGVALALLVALGVGCSGADEPELSDPDSAPSAADAPDATTSADPGDTIHVAQALESRLVVRDRPERDADEVATLVASDQASGKIICLVVRQVGDWVEVHLPEGPVDRSGWVARDDVALSRHRFRIEVARGAHTLTLYTGEAVALSTPVALGPDAPPAGEELFIKELVQPPVPDGAYRSYAYGLSGAPNDLAAFTAGQGVVAVHGVADPAGLGTDVASGSIGVGIDIVMRMADTIGLPLGTPVDIVD